MRKRLVAVATMLVLAALVALPAAAAASVYVTDLIGTNAVIVSSAE